jgi:putative flippase GtrA
MDQRPVPRASGTRHGAVRQGLLGKLRRLAHEVAKFGAVGAIGFLVNVAVFNLCIHTFQLAPIRSGVMAQVVAIGTNYLGNRYWTYRNTDKHRVRRETVLFFFFSGIALVIENAVLAVSHYGLGYTSPLADNVAKNVIGLGIGTVFRFWSYRTWVFRTAEDGDRPGSAIVDRVRGRGVRGVRGARGVRGGLAAKEEREDRRMLLK